jgi:uracil-DNA glycosylase family 4
MDPSRRHLYLDAMGIQSWCPRVAVGGDWAEMPLEAAGAGGEEAMARLDPAPTSLPRQAVPLVRVPSLAPEAASGPSYDIAGLDWDALQARVAACQACGLWETRTQTVFGVGRHDADLMLIGEAPGADEDRQGEPFVGRAGQLLNRMLAAIGLNRGQVYIANILKCRPPGNRDPKPEEAAACRAFLMAQIERVRPRIILSLGRISAQHLLATGEAVGRLRGRWFSFGPDAVPLMVTFHPSYLLRAPEQKALAWRDLAQVAKRLRGL